MSKERELLKGLRQVFLFDIGDDGQPKASILEIYDLWNRVNDVLANQPKTVTDNEIEDEGEAYELERLGKL